MQAEREHMYTQYHELRTSPTFHKIWDTFLLEAIKTNPGPHITSILLNESSLTLLTENTSLPARITYPQPALNISQILRKMPLDTSQVTSAAK